MSAHFSHRFPLKWYTSYFPYLKGAVLPRFVALHSSVELQNKTPARQYISYNIGKPTNKRNIGKPIHNRNIGMQLTR